MKKEKLPKARTSFCISEEALLQCDKNLKLSNCKTRSEYINKAVEFYNGTLASEVNQDFLAEALSNTVLGIVSLSEQRITRMQFKIAVELAKITKMIAPLCGLDSRQLEKLHVDCVNEVKRINGVITYDKAVQEHRSEM